MLLPHKEVIVLSTVEEKRSSKIPNIAGCILEKNRTNVACAKKRSQIAAVAIVMLEDVLPRTIYFSKGFFNTISV